MFRRWHMHSLERCHYFLVIKHTWEAESFIKSALEYLKKKFIKKLLILMRYKTSISIHIWCPRRHKIENTYLKTFFRRVSPLSQWKFLVHNPWAPGGGRRDRSMELPLSDGCLEVESSPGVRQYLCVQTFTSDPTDRGNARRNLQGGGTSWQLL